MALCGVSIQLFWSVMLEQFDVQENHLVFVAFSCLLFLINVWRFVISRMHGQSILCMELSFTLDHRKILDITMLM